MSGARLASAQAQAARKTGAPEPERGTSVRMSTARSSSAEMMRRPRSLGSASERSAEKSLESGAHKSAARIATWNPEIAKRWRVPVRVKRSASSGPSSARCPKRSAPKRARVVGSGCSLSASSPAVRASWSGRRARVKSGGELSRTRRSDVVMSVGSGRPAEGGTGPSTGRLQRAGPRTETSSPSKRAPFGMESR